MAVTVNTSGLMSSSGFDVQGLVDQMIQASRAPETLWKNQKSQLTAQASALTDLSSKLSDLETRVQSLTDVLGTFATRAVSSSNTSILSASATSAATIGQHTVVVSSLATRASYYSDTAVASTDTVISGGSITLTKGSSNHTLTIGGSNNTLAKLATAINALGMGITATVISDASGARLSIVGNDTGHDNDFTVTNSADSALTFKHPSSAQTASLTVDGVPVTSASNQVSDVIPGLTLSLNGQQEGFPVTLTVSSDTSQVSQAISDFVTAYNALIQGINAEFKYDENSGASGALAGDSAVRTVQEQILHAVGTVKVSGNPFSTIGAIGITMNDDGTLMVDSSKLGSALECNFGAVQDFFQNSTDGFATRLGTLMASLTDSVDGPFVVDLKGISNTQADLTETIDDFEDRLAIKRQQLVDQLSQVNAALQQLPTMQKQIDAMLGTLNSSSNQ